MESREPEDTMQYLKNLFAAFLIALSASAWAAPLNVNTATSEELADVMKNVGPAKADAIVKERDANGPFASLEDLQQRVKGIGPATIQQNEGLISVEAGTTEAGGAEQPVKK